MRRIERSDIGEILQRIYDSEIDIRIGWLWDAGFDYVCDQRDMWSAPVAPVSTGETDVVAGIERMCLQLLVEHPRSEFTEWFNSEFTSSNDEA